MLRLFIYLLFVNTTEELSALQKNLLFTLLIIPSTVTQVKVQVDMKLSPTQNPRAKVGRGHTPYHQSESSWPGCH